MSYLKNGATKAYVDGAVAGASGAGASGAPGASGIPGASGASGVPASGLLTIETKTASYTFTIDDAGKCFITSGTGEYVFTIPSNASVAYSVGTKITLINGGNSDITVAITSDTMRWLNVAGYAQSGTAKIKASESCELIKHNTTNWWLNRFARASEVYAP